MAPALDWEGQLQAAADSAARLGPAESAGSVLVAGVGNIFFADDGFGVEVARRLVEGRVPAGATVTDFGIRGVHLAYELLKPYRAVIIVDAVDHGDPPGTVSVIEPEVDADGGDGVLVAVDAHGMDPAAVLAMAEDMGATLGQVRVVACEAGSAEEGIGLTDAVAAAVPMAVDVVLELLASILDADEQEVRA